MALHDKESVLTRHGVVRHIGAMKLRQWRQTHKLTIAQAAERFGIKHPRTFQRYETGEILADAPFVRLVVAQTDGEVTPADFYDQRAEFLGLLIKEAAE